MIVWYGLKRYIRNCKEQAIFGRHYRKIIKDRERCERINRRKEIGGK